MPLSVEELMKVRYKVIARFPQMNFIGDSGFMFNEIFTPELKHGTFFHNECDVDSYPHLFRKLEWWMNIELEDFPMFVKDEHGQVWQIYECQKNSNYVLLFKNLKHEIPYGNHNLYELFPATEQEFLNYINKQ